MSQRTVINSAALQKFLEVISDSSFDSTFTVFTVTALFPATSWDEPTICPPQSTEEKRKLPSDYPKNRK